MAISGNQELLSGHQRGSKKTSNRSRASSVVISGHQWYSVVLSGTRGTHQWYPSEVIKYVLDLGARVPGLGVVHNGRYEDVCDVGDLVVVLASAELGS